MMNSINFLTDYFSQFKKAVEHDGICDSIVRLRDAIRGIQSEGSKIVMAGNGASASISSHFAVDFTKQGKVRTLSFNDASLITAYGNDYGYERWVEKALEHHCSQGDLCILISSSGRSPNIVNAAKKAKSMGMTVATFTGFDPDNDLKRLGDINFWVDSKSYNIIESVHSFWLAATCDLLIGNSEYGVTDFPPKNSTSNYTAKSIVS